MNCKTQNTTLSCLWSVYPGQIDTIFENSLWFLCFILQNRNNKCLWYSFASVLWCCDFANLTDYVLQLQPTIILCIYQYLQFQHTEGYNTNIFLTHCFNKWFWWNISLPVFVFQYLLRLCCGASTMCTHGLVFYCVFRFRYFVLFLGVQHVFQPVSWVKALQSANLNTHNLQNQIHVKHTIRLQSRVPQTTTLFLYNMKLIYWLTSLDGWRKKQGLTMISSELSVCWSDSGQPNYAASLNTQWPECGDLEYCYENLLLLILLPLITHRPPTCWNPHCLAGWCFTGWRSLLREH